MCGLRQSVGFLHFRSSVFCLPWAEKPCSVPACLARRHQVSPESTRKTAAWRERPLVATVQMIVTCAKRQKRMCLVEEPGRKGSAELQGSCLLVLPSAASCLSPQYLSWTLCSCCPSTPPQNPAYLQTCLPKGFIPCFLQSRILSWILPREGLELSP